MASQKPDNQPEDLSSAEEPENADLSSAEATTSPRQPGTISQPGKIPSKKEVLENLDKTYNFYNHLLSWKERLKMTYVDKRVDEAYYRMWNHDANQFFRRVVLLKQRRQAIKDGKAL